MPVTFTCSRGDEAQYAILSRQLAEAASSDKLEKSSSSTKKLLLLLEELSSPIYVAVPLSKADLSLDNSPLTTPLLIPLCRLLKYDEPRVQSMAVHVLSCLYQRMGVSSAPLDASVALALKLWKDVPRVVDTDSVVMQVFTLRCFLEVYTPLLRRFVASSATSATSATLALPDDLPKLEIPSNILAILDKGIKFYSTLKREKKKVLIKTAKYYQEKKDRSQYHWALLRCFHTCFSYLALASPGLLQALAGNLANTAIEYSSKPKEVNLPIIREALGILVLYAQAESPLPAPITAIEKSLPTVQANMTHSPLEKKKKEKKKKDAGAVPSPPPLFPVTDVLTAVHVLQLCFAMLRKDRRMLVAGEGKANSAYAACVKQLIHHPSAYVFSETMQGLLSYDTDTDSNLTTKSIGLLFPLLLDRDTFYSSSSSDLLLDYVLSRITTLLSSTGQLEVHAGLRLAISLVAHTTRYLNRGGESAAAATSVLDAATPTFLDMLGVAMFRVERTVLMTYPAFAFCPNILVSSFKLLLWLSAFFLTLPRQTSAKDLEISAHQQLDLLGGTIASILTHIEQNANWTATHSTSLLEAFLALLRCGVQDSVRLAMIPHFTGLVRELFTQQLGKVSVPVLSGLLKTLLNEVDISAADGTVANASSADGFFPTPASAKLAVEEASDFFSYTPSATASSASTTLARTNSIRTADPTLNDLDAVAVPYSRENVAGYTMALVLQFVRKLLAAQQQQHRQGRGGANGSKVGVAVLVETVGFIGEFGNVMCASYQNKSGAANAKIAGVIQLLAEVARAQTQSELTRECLLALAKIACRSKPPIRAYINQVLSELAQLWSSTSKSGSSALATFTRALNVMVQELMAMSQGGGGSSGASLGAWAAKHESLRALVGANDLLKS